jgi:hypothetical protein
MSSMLKVVALPPAEAAELAEICQQTAYESGLSRLEIAVKSRVEAGIENDNDLRLADDLLHQVVLGADAIDQKTKPYISAAYALHKALVAEAKRWKNRWLSMQEQLDRLIINYKRKQRELLLRQQEELVRAEEERRKRKEAEARAALRNGDLQAAKIAMQEAQMVVVPMLNASEPVLENTKVRKEWQVQITDPAALVQQIAAGVIPLCAIKEFDLSFFRKEAAKRGGLPPTWAGVSAKQVEALSHKRQA